MDEINFFATCDILFRVHYFVFNLSTNFYQFLSERFTLVKWLYVLAKNNQPKRVNRRLWILCKPMSDVHTLFGLTFHTYSINSSRLTNRITCKTLQFEWLVDMKSKIDYFGKFSLVGRSFKDCFIDDFTILYYLPGLGMCRRTLVSVISFVPRDLR